MTIEIVAAKLVSIPGQPDRVSLITTLTEAVHPYEEPLELELRCSHGTGREWLARHAPSVPLVSAVEKRSR